MAVELAAAPNHGREREKRARLARQPLLAGCSPLTLRRISAVADEITAHPGEVLVWQGRHVFWFFLIQQGRADVVRDGRTVGQLADGQYFGEVVLERERTQPASIVATTPMRLFVIASQRFVPLAHDVGPLRRRLGVAPVRHRRRRRLPHGRPDPPRVRRPLVVVPPPRKRRRALLVLAIAAVALGAGATYHPPLALVTPGPSFDVAAGITIAGVPADPIRGRYLLTSVDVERPSLLGVVVGVFRSDDEIVSSNRVAAPPSERRRQAARFRESRRTAAAAAARALGLPVGTDASGNPVLPFDIEFQAEPVVGPSAGLAYALAIVDLLSPEDLSRGRSIAATGELDAHGKVGLVSHLAGKANAARSGGAEVFVLPGAQSYAAAGHGMRVTGVSSLEEAVAALLAP